MNLNVFLNTLKKRGGRINFKKKIVDLSGLNPAKFYGMWDDISDLTLKGYTVRYPNDYSQYK